MVNRKKTSRRETQRVRRHQRIRKQVYGRPDRPRLVVHRSRKNIQAQIVDDLEGRVLCGVSTVASEFDEVRDDDEATKVDLSREAGKRIAERAKEAGVSRVVFDRGGYLYHGRVAAFAEGAREAGLEF